MTKRPSTWIAFIHLVVIVLGIEVYLLAMQNKKLKDEIGKRSVPEILRSGDIIPRFSAYDMEGKERLIGYNDLTKLYLLFIFSTKCHFCEQNLPNWADVSKSIDNNKVIIVGISTQDLDATRSYFQEKRLPFVVLVPKDKSFSKDYKINVVPQTILVGRGGIIRKIWEGVLDEKKKMEIISCTQ